MENENYTLSQILVKLWDSSFLVCTNVFSGHQHTRVLERDPAVFCLQTKPDPFQEFKQYTEFAENVFNKATKLFLPTRSRTVSRNLARANNLLHQ